MPFLTFEGIDGSGKSSLLKNFADYLKSLSIPVEMTREPGGSELGREIRQMLLKTSGQPPCPETELLLYEADRAQHVKHYIKPWLEKNIWVLSDRFADSSTAFQGAGRDIAPEKVQWLNDFATQGVHPDFTIIVDCPVEVGLARLQKREKERNSKPDRFEQEKENFHKAVRNEYLKMAKTNKRFFLLDGTKDQENLLQELIKEVRKRGLL